MLRSFRTALLIFIVSAAILPVLVVSIPFVTKIYTMTREGAVKELGLTAERVVADMQHDVDSIASHFVSIGRDKDMVLAVSSPFFGVRGIALSTEFLKESPLVESVYLLDSGLDPIEALPEATATADLNHVIAAVRAHMPDPTDFRDRAAWLVLEDPALVAQLASNRKEAMPPADKRVLVLAMPLFFEHYVQDRSNVMQGMLIALIPLERMTRAARRHLQPYQGLSLAVEGQPHGGSPNSERQVADASLYIKGALPQDLRLRVEVDEPNAVRFKGVHLTLVLFSLFVVVVTALFSFLAFTLARRLARPLDRIRQLAHEYAAANYRPAIVDVDFDEFQQIAAALGTMGRRIEQQLEELRNTNEQLLQADKLKDDFLANTSHELRTPLHGIIGIASSMSDGAAGELSPKVRKNLVLIEQSGRRLENLVNDILDFSKIRNSALRLELKPVELFSLVDVIVSLHALQAEKAGLQLINAVPRTLPLAEADEFRLQQILHNLVGNAIKFSAQGEVVVSARRDGDFIQVSVRDSGIGIPPDKQASIFEPFVQIEGALTRSHSGSGLGLTISRNLVELHGGRLSVESSLSSGSTFSFTLPVAHNQDADTVVQISAFSDLDSETIDTGATIEAGADAGGEWTDDTLSFDNAHSPQDKAHVLVVDDENINIQILTNYFFDEPYILHVARNGPDALDLLERLDRVDLILLDVMMPKMSGFEVCCRIRVNPRFAHVPILFLTARNQAKDIHHGFYYGCNDYLVKPVSRIELLTRCHYHLHYARLKQELATLNSSLERQVESRTQELQKTLALRQSSSQIFRLLLDISIELQGHAPLAQRLDSTLDRLMQIQPERGFAIIVGGEMHNRLPPGPLRQLRLALEQELPWWDDGWLAEQDLASIPLIDPGGTHAALLLWPRRMEASEAEVAEFYARQLAVVIENHRLTEELQRVSIIDALTGVYNRHFFERAFAHLSYNHGRHPERQFCLMAINLNGLKQVNEDYGHAAGDAVLIHTVKLLQETLRQSDVLCRVGGDEFMVIVEETSYLNGIVLCERLRARQSDARFDWADADGHGVILPISFSLGLASSEHMSPSALPAAADLAMRQAKQRFYREDLLHTMEDIGKDLVLGRQS